MVGALWFHLLSFTGTFVFLSFKTGDILLFEYFHPLSTETEDRKTKKRGDWKASEMWSPSQLILHSGYYKPGVLLLRKGA